MDEKRFLLGVCRFMKCIVFIGYLRNKKLFGSAQDGFREFIFLLVCICVDGTALPLVLIYENISNDLQDIWLEDFDVIKDQVYFVVFFKGWINEELGLFWFTRLFESKTTSKAGNRMCLLIFDSHSSHMNLAFINACKSQKIISVILLLHSTHQL